jgi:hypothetical protein
MRSLIFFVILLFSFSAMAQDMPVINSGIGKAVSVNIDSADVGGDVGVSDDRFGLGVPLYMSESTSLAANFKGQSITLERSLVIPDRALVIPKNFGGADLGVSAYFTGAKVNQGFSGSIGTTGRKLFDSENSRSLSATYFREWKNGGGATWFLFLSYANNRSTLNNVPLPGMGYAKGGENYRYFIGLPLLYGSWNPERWRFVGVVSPFTASAQAGYVVREPWQVLSSVAWLPRSFQNIAPDVKDERLLYDKKEWSTGVAFNPAPPISASLLYVYQFDRRFFIGRSTSDRRSSALNLADGGGVQVKVRWVF